MRISALKVIQALVMVVGLPLCTFASNEQPLIQVRDSVEIEMENEITIGDIADFKGFEESQLGEIRSVHLADAPSSGEIRSFTNVGLSQIFRRHLPKLQNGRNVKITLMIPTMVIVKRKAFKLEAKTIEAELARQWSANCEGCEFRFNNISMPIIAGELNPKSQWQIRLRPELPKGSFSVPLEVINGVSKTSYWISGQVSIYRMVPVAKRMIEGGERFTANDFKLEKKDVTFTIDSFPTESEIVSSIAARTISGDQIIGRSMLRREQAVKSGDVVKVVAGNEAWQVTIDAVAQQSGHIGDTVRVRVPRTQKLLSGILREKGLVEVR